MFERPEGGAFSERLAAAKCGDCGDRHDRHLSNAAGGEHPCQDCVSCKGFVDVELEDACKEGPDAS